MSEGDLLEILSQAKSARVSRSTAQNTTSSRSHLIIRFELVSIESNFNQKNPKIWAESTGSITFVDLAGSEKYDINLPKNDNRLKETCSINKRLFLLVFRLYQMLFWLYIKIRNMFPLEVLF